MHGYDASVLLRDPWWLRKYRVLFSHASGIIVPSKFLAGNLAAVGCPVEKLHVSPYGVNPQNFCASTPEPYSVIAVGRMVRKKSPQTTVRAFALVRALVPKARLEIVGDGPLLGECLLLAGRLGLDDSVRFHGWQSPEVVARLMGRAALFVQHSVTDRYGDSEGMPVAVLEAMACAVPVVSTRHSGIPEAVEDGTTGLLVDEHDVDGMADKMARVLTDPSLARRLGDAGRRRILSSFTHVDARNRLRAIMGLPAMVGSGPSEYRLGPSFETRN
jgi:glycosyltransferase involved in cell wall biosynthesis